MTRLLDAICSVCRRHMETISESKQRDICLANASSSEPISGTFASRQGHLITGTAGFGLSRVHFSCWHTTHAHPTCSKALVLCVFKIKFQSQVPLYLSILSSDGIRSSFVIKSNRLFDEN